MVEDYFGNIKPILIWLYCPSCNHDGQKLFLGMGYIDMKKLDQEMHRFHINKIVEETDGFRKGKAEFKTAKNYFEEKIFCKF